MPFHVSLVGRKHLSREIYRQIVRAILDGRLRPGDRLTPSRELALALDVSRMTVNVAYEQLAGEGFVTSRQGAGTFVSDLVSRVERKSPQPRAKDALQPRPIWKSIPVLTPFARAARYDFRSGLPDATLFPHRAWQRSVVRALLASESSAGVYGDAAGLRDLREAIVRQIGFSRGVEAAPNDVIVTNGTQQALDLIARVWLAPGDTIALEEPGYGLPWLLFTAMGFRVVGVPVDNEGIVVTALPRKARAVYVTPSHQYPLGVVMTLRRRQALLAWAERNNAAIIEDDYDSEFRFGGRPLEPLQSIDSSGRVIYIGSFSKTMLPTLRLGFLITPPSLRPALQSAKFVSDWHSSSLAQVALARFMADGGFARHLRKMTGVYRERRAMIRDILACDFNEHLELVPSEAGLHVAAFARNATVDHVQKIIGRAADRSVAVQRLWPHAFGPDARAGLMLGYGAISTSRIKEGLRLLRSCFDRAA
ncbi:MAG TPA: PLP-dependent aminotransferase family protein [Candidatus Synoicihabitans sp.]|nr:PLP-dependent aminotransferase family protein [Candidatus Synoicihabitans sp.]